MGVVIDGQGEENYLFQNLHRNAGTAFGHVEWIRDVARVTGQFYGAKKLAWESLQKNGITVEKDAGKYDVVWSHVNLRLINDDLDNSIFLNNNLTINKHSGEPNTWAK